MTLPDDYIARLTRRRRHSPATISLYAYRLNRYARTFDPLTVTADELEEWVYAIGGESYVCGWVSTIAGFHRWLQRSGVRADDPTGDLAGPKLSRPLPRPLSSEEEARLWAAHGGCAWPRTRAWLTLGLLCGLRASEISVVEKANVYDGNLWVKGKGSRERVVPLHPRARAVILDPQWPDVGAIFRTGTGRTLRPHYVSNRMGHHFDRAGVDGGAHRLRHTFATRFIDEGGLLEDLMVTMGHSDPKTTMRYVAWNQVRARAAILRM